MWTCSEKEFNEIAALSFSAHEVRLNALRWTLKFNSQLSKFSCLSGRLLVFPLPELFEDK